MTIWSVGLVRKRQGIWARGRKRERVEGLGSDPNRSGKEGLVKRGAGGWELNEGASFIPDHFYTLIHHIPCLDLTQKIL